MSSVHVNRENKLHAFAMGRTLSLLVALACLSSPEFARQLTHGRGFAGAAGSSRALTRTGQAQTARVLRVFRAPAACLKFARNSTLRALYQWALAEAEADSWAPVLERIAVIRGEVAQSAAGPPSYYLFERPPPVSISVTV